MAKRRLKLMMDLSYNNNDVQNNEHKVHNLADIISTATIVFGKPELNPSIEVGNTQLIQDNLMLQNAHLDNFEMYSTMNSDENIEQDNEVLEIPLDFNVDDEMLAFPLEYNEILNQDILEPNDVDDVLEEYRCENEQMDVENINLNAQSIIKCNNTRNVKPQPNKWKRKTSQRLRMNGKGYIEFQRKGNVVSQDMQRPARNIQPTCESKFCIKAKNRFCQSFDENQRVEIFSTFWNASRNKKDICIKYGN